MSASTTSQTDLLGPRLKFDPESQPEPFNLTAFHHKFVDDNTADSLDLEETLQEMSSISRDFANWAHVRTKRIDTDDFKNLSDAGKAIQVEEENQNQSRNAFSMFLTSFRSAFQALAP